MGCAPSAVILNPTSPAQAASVRMRTTAAPTSAGVSGGSRPICRAMSASLTRIQRAKAATASRPMAVSRVSTGSTQWTRSPSDAASGATQRANS